MVLIVIIIYVYCNVSVKDFFSFFENVDRFNKKIDDYSEAAYGWKSTVLFLITKTLIPVGLFYWAKIKFNFKVKYESFICLFGILGVCSIFNTIIFTRFTNYLVVFYCIALSELLIPFLKIRIMTLSKLFIMCSLLFMVICYGYVSFFWPDRYYRKWVPYYSIFSIEARTDQFIDRKY